MQLSDQDGYQFTCAGGAVSPVQGYRFTRRRGTNSPSQGVLFHLCKNNVFHRLLWKTWSGKRFV